MKLRLYHHHDGARIAYREAGTGPPLALIHSAGLSHREFEPLVEELSDRFRLVLPDLPLHGDSEDRPRHLRRRPVGEEVEDREAADQDRAGQGQRRELDRAEMTDDRGVDEHLERLGRERAERGHREVEDLAVVG